MDRKAADPGMGHGPGGRRLFMAGPSDIMDVEDPVGAIEGRREDDLLSGTGVRTADSIFQDYPLQCTTQPIPSPGP